MPSTTLKLPNLNQDHVSKKKGFRRSNRYKTEVMITSLTEMPELPNLYYTNTCTIEFDSRDKISLVAEITTSRPFFRNAIILSRFG